MTKSIELKRRKTTSFDKVPVGFQLVCSEVYMRGSFPKSGLPAFHCSFTIQKAIGGTRAVQQSTSTNSLAVHVTQASLNIFKEHQI